MKNEKCTLKDLEYGERTENHWKWEIHTLESEIWRRKLKKVESLEMSTVERGIWQENWKSWKMRNAHCRTWNMALMIKDVEHFFRSFSAIRYSSGENSLFSSESHFFKKYLFVYFMCMSTPLLSSDTPEEGIRSHYRWLWATNVVAGNWIQDLWKGSQCS